MTYPCAIFNTVDVKLHGNVKAVKEVAPKHQCVLRGVYSVNPPCNAQDSVAEASCYGVLHTSLCMCESNNVLPPT